MRIFSYTITQRLVVVITSEDVWSVNVSTSSLIIWRLFGYAHKLHWQGVCACVYVCVVTWQMVHKSAEWSTCVSMCLGIMRRLTLNRCCKKILQRLLYGNMLDSGAAVTNRKKGCETFKVRVSILGEATNTPLKQCRNTYSLCVVLSQNDKHTLLWLHHHSDSTSLSRLTLTHTWQTPPLCPLTHHKPTIFNRSLS